MNKMSKISIKTYALLMILFTFPGVLTLTGQIVSVEDFELGFGDLVNVTTGDDFDWTRDSAGTPSSSTGPYDDHTLGSTSVYYAYIETSSGGANNMGSEAILESALIDADAGDYGLVFYYHMYGSNIGSLHVDIFANGEWLLDVWTVSGQQQISSTDDFDMATVRLDQYTGIIKFRIRAVTAGGFMGDTAIDDVAIMDASVNADGDFLPDYWENLYGLDPNDPSDQALDLDGDNMPNHIEYLLNLSPANPDTDGDGAYDNWEFVNGLDPLDSSDGALDPDGDGLDNTAEFINSCNPLDPDTDNDGMPDGWEVSNGLAPWTWTDRITDLDGDGELNYEEYRIAIAQLELSFDDFESGWGSLVNLTSNDTDNWLRDSGGTPSSSTGPLNDVTLDTTAGYYAYMETSSGYAYVAGEDAILESGLYDADANYLFLQFKYHMYGSTMGSLHVDVFSDSTWNMSVWSISGQQQTSYADSYSTAMVDLSSYTGQIRFRIRGVAAGGFMGDMAIDDVVVMPDINADADGDGLPYFWEEAWGLDDSNPADANEDMDADGLSNSDEYTYNLFPDDPDMDLDGLSDGWEINHVTNGFNPVDNSDANVDTDLDGLMDWTELNIIEADTGDGLTSFADVLPGDDFDGDGLTNIDEQTWETDPVVADTDYDGCIDGDEVNLDGTDPLDQYDYTPLLLSSFNFKEAGFLGDNGQEPKDFFNLEVDEGITGNGIRIPATGDSKLNYFDLQADGHPNINLEHGTVSFWYSPDWSSQSLGGTGPGDYARIFCMGRYNNPAPFIGFWAIIINPEGEGINIGSRSGSTFKASGYIGQEFVQGRWYHIVVTFTGTERSMYINGVQKYSTLTWDLDIYPDETIRSWGMFIGSNDQGKDRADGRIDKLEIYNYPIDHGPNNGPFSDPSYVQDNYLNTDGDSLSDDWEWGVINADPNDQYDDLDDLTPYGDFDGDGISNGFELAHGLNPLDDTDPAAEVTGKIKIVFSDGGDHEVELPTLILLN